MRRSLALGVLAAALAAVAVVYALFFRLSDEERIRARLEQLAAVIRIDAGAQGAADVGARAGRVQRVFAEVFTEDARAEVEEIEETLEGRPALVAAAVELGGAYSSADVRFDKVVVRVSGEAADVRAVGVVTGAERGKSAAEEEVSVRFQWKKLDGEWRITSAVVSPRRAAQE